MLFKSKQYNSKDLYVVCLCKYTTHNHNGHISTDAKIIDFYIAKGYGKFFSIITKNGYEAESVENATFNNTYGIEEYFPLPANLVKGNDNFILRVKGESMINAGILSGDIVIVERRNTASNGEIVVAMTDENEVTLKTYYKEDGYFRLQPENDTMAPIILNNVTILGKAIGLYRKI